MKCCHEALQCFQLTWPLPGKYFSQVVDTLLQRKYSHRGHRSPASWKGVRSAPGSFLGLFWDSLQGAQFRRARNRSSDSLPSRFVDITMWTIHSIGEHLKLAAISWICHHIFFCWKNSGISLVSTEIIWFGRISGIIKPELGHLCQNRSFLVHFHWKRITSKQLITVSKQP